MRSVWPSALVHTFTASGAVCALLALRAGVEARWEALFAWLGIALIIDGIDGTFARMANVTVNLPRFSGERLDLVVDYLTYVVVPAVALWLAGLLPGSAGWLLPSLILLSSLFHFSDTESKAEDYAFVGFPAIWNIVAFYIFAFAPPVWATTLIVLLCVVLTFLPWKWVHPLRTRRLRPVTLAVCGIWGLAAAWALWVGFPATGPAWAILLLCALYALVLTAIESLAR